MKYLAFLSVLLSLSMMPLELQAADSPASEEVDVIEISTRLRTERLTASEKVALLTDPLKSLEGNDLSRHWNFVLRQISEVNLGLEINESIVRNALGYLKTLPATDDLYTLNVNKDLSEAFTRLAVSPVVISKSTAREILLTLLSAASTTQDALSTIVGYYTYWSNEKSEYPARMEILSEIPYLKQADREFSEAMLATLLEPRGTTPSGSLVQASKLTYSELVSVMKSLVLAHKLSPETTERAKRLQDIFYEADVFRLELERSRVAPIKTAISFIDTLGVSFAIPLNEWFVDANVDVEQATILARHLIERALIDNAPRMPKENDVLRFWALTYDLGDELQLQVLNSVMKEKSAQMDVLYHIEYSETPLSSRVVQAVLERVVDLSTVTVVDPSDPNKITSDLLVEMYVLPLKDCGNSKSDGFCKYQLDKAAIYRKIAANPNLSTSIREKAEKEIKAP